MSRGSYGKPGIYNATPLTLGDEEGVALAVDSKGRLILSPTGGVTSIADNRKVVTTAGTAVPLVSSSTPCDWIIITAETDNTGIIVVGGSTVVAALATRRGVPLSPGDSVTIQVEDLANIYIDSTVNGDGVTFTYA